jgi:hypothetical protein
MPVEHVAPPTVSDVKSGGNLSPVVDAILFAVSLFCEVIELKI